MGVGIGVLCVKTGTLIIALLMATEILCNDNSYLIALAYILAMSK